MIIDTSKITSKDKRSYMDQHQIYNGLDACVTLEIFEVLHEQLLSKNEPQAALIYDFERGMQAVALDMMQRGFLIDAYEKDKLLENFRKMLLKLERRLNILAHAVWPFDLNARSYKQLKEFFYEAMGLPEQVISIKGVKRVSCNRESLEKLSAYFYTIPIINHIFEIRDLTKKISVLATKISPNGRFHSTFSPASTETGRWTSSKDAFGEGGNQQNITPELRRIFIADPGHKLLHFDQEQAESRVVGLLMLVLCNNPTYLRACEEGDLHTNVAKMLWPDKVFDRASADEIFYRHFSYRDLAKRGGHLSNYKGGPLKMARALQLPFPLCQSFQEQYYERFGFEKWFSATARELQLNQSLTTPLGMQREFYSNPYDDATLREAIAFRPQSTVGQLTALIADRARRFIPELQALTNDHDGFTWQFAESGPEHEASLVRRLAEISSVEITFQGKSLIIPVEISTGWNWAKAHPKTNPEGLLKWRGSDGRSRAIGTARTI